MAIRFPWEAVVVLGAYAAGRVVDPKGIVGLGPGDLLTAARMLYLYGVTTKRWQQLREKASSSKLGHRLAPLNQNYLRLRLAMDDPCEVLLRFIPEKEELEILSETGHPIRAKVLDVIRQLARP